MRLSGGSEWEVGGRWAVGDQAEAAGIKSNFIDTYAGGVLGLD